MQTRLIVSVFVISCVSEVSKPKPQASVHVQGPVALGTPIDVGTTWEGSCSGGLFGAFWGGGESASNSTRPCNAVEHDVTVKCDGDTCTPHQLAGGTWQVIPTKVGTLTAHVRLNAKGSTKGKVIDLQPIEVRVPDSATARCNLWRDDTARVDVWLAAGKDQLQHASDVRVTGGDACKVGYVSDVADPYVGTYRCGIHAQEAELDISTKAYALHTTVACQVVLPTPGPHNNPNDTSTRFVLNGATSSENRDDILRITRRRLEKWGWTVGSVDAGAQKTTIAASKLGSTVEIEIAESPGPEFVIYTWSYTVGSGAVIGVQDVPGWAVSNEY